MYDTEIRHADLIWGFESVKQILLCILLKLNFTDFQRKFHCTKKLTHNAKY
jgi:hypothetical protein